MVQIVLAIIIIILGFICFKLYPLEKGNVKKLAFSSLMIVLTLVLKRLSIMVPLFGTESLKIGLEYIPLMVSGFILSPSYAFMIGICSDLVGLIVTPTGFPFFGFTLSTTLVAVIPSFVKVHSSSFNEKTLYRVASVIIGLMFVGASLFIFNLDSVKLTTEVITLTLQHKLILCGLVLLFSLIFLIIIYVLRKRFSSNEAETFSKWILCVITTEFIVSLILIPLWLQLMYGIPFFVSLCIRIVKLCVIIPFETIVCYTITSLTKSLKL